jgi:hypothetical protein
MPLCNREAILESITNPTEETTQRKDSVSTPVEKVDNPVLLAAA